MGLCECECVFVIGGVKTKGITSQCCHYMWLCQLKPSNHPARLRMAGWGLYYYLFCRNSCSHPSSSHTTRMHSQTNTLLFLNHLLCIIYCLLIWVFVYAVCCFRFCCNANGISVQWNVLVPVFPMGFYRDLRLCKYCFNEICCLLNCRIGVRAVLRTITYRLLVSG